MNRITSLQLFALLLLPGIWELLCIREITGMGMLLGILAGYALQWLLLLPICAADGGLFRRRWASLLYAGFFLLAGARSLSQLTAAAPTALAAVPGKLGAAALLLVTCLFTAVCGIRSAARCAPMALFLLGISGIVLLAGAWGHLEFSRLPAAGNGFREGGRHFFLAPELPAFWVLRRRLDKSPRKVLTLSFLAKSLTAGLLLTLCIAAGGRLCTGSDAPVFTLTALSQPLQGQRADALYILVFVMLSVMQLTVMAGLTAHLLEETFPRLHHTALAVLPTALLASILLPQETHDALTAMLVPVLAFGVPCTVQLLQTLRKRVIA